MIDRQAQKKQKSFNLCSDRFAHVQGCSATLPRHFRSDLAKQVFQEFISPVGAALSLHPARFPKHSIWLDPCRLTSSMQLAPKRLVQSLGAEKPASTRRVLRQSARPMASLAQRLNHDARAAGEAGLAAVQLSSTAGESAMCRVQGWWHVPAVNVHFTSREAPRSRICIRTDVILKCMHSCCLGMHTVPVST